MSSPNACEPPQLEEFDEYTPPGPFYYADRSPTGWGSGIPLEESDEYTPPDPFYYADPADPEGSLPSGRLSTPRRTPPGRGTGTPGTPLGRGAGTPGMCPGRGTGIPGTPFGRGAGTPGISSGRGAGTPRTSPGRGDGTPGVPPSPSAPTANRKECCPKEICAEMHNHLNDKYPDDTRTEESKLYEALLRVSGNDDSTEDPAPLQVDPAKQLNIVLPTLEEMLHYLMLGIKHFAEEKVLNLDNLDTVMERNMRWSTYAQRRICEVENVIVKGIRPIPKFVTGCEKVSQKLNEFLNKMQDPANPVPNLKDLKHPSSQVSEEKLKKIIMDMVVLCDRANRLLRVTEIMYDTFDEGADNMKREIDSLHNRISYLHRGVYKMKRNENNMVKMFKEHFYVMEGFLREWKNGPDELNQPRIWPRYIDFEPKNLLPMPKLPDLTLKGLRDCMEAPSSLGSIMDWRLGKREESPVPPIEEMLNKYHRLVNNVERDVESNRVQNEVLEQSVAAMQEIPENQEHTKPETPPVPT